MVRDRVRFRVRVRVRVRVRPGDKPRCCLRSLVPRALWCGCQGEGKGLRVSVHVRGKGCLSVSELNFRF